MNSSSSPLIRMILATAVILGLCFMPVALSLNIVDTVLTVSTPFTLADNEVLSMTNATLILDTLSITVGLNVQFQFSLNCHIQSLQTLAILTPVSIQSSSASSTISTLKLSNVDLSFTSTSTFSDTILELDSTSLLVAKIATGYFAYTSALTASSTNLFTGGKLVVVPGATAAIAAGFQVSTSQTSPPTVNLGTSTIFNAKNFLSNVPLVVDGSKLMGGQFCNYQFQAPISGAGSLNFSYCSVSMVAVNMNGGSVNFLSSTWNLGNYIANVVSTTLNFNAYTNVLATYSTVQRETFGSIVLGANSFVNFNDPATANFTLAYPPLVVGSVNNYTSVHFNLIHSADGNINCNGATSTTRFRTPGLINPNIIYTSGSAVTFKKAQGFTKCAAGSVSFYIYTTDNPYEADNILAADCPAGESRCGASFSCLSQASINAGDCLLDMYCMRTEPVGGSLFCWTGQCTVSYETCPPLPSCPPSLPLRCTDGCKAATATCDPCPAGTNPTPFGCLAAGAPVQPYQGCDAFQYQCPDNYACVSSPSQCSNYGTTKVPSSNRVMVTATLVYQQTRATASILQRYVSPATPFTIGSNIFLDLGSNLPATSDHLKIAPYADSYATKVSSSLISSTFDYYSNLLSPPFKLTLRDSQMNILTVSTTSSIYFKNPNPSLNLSNACLAYVNSANQWQCTSFPLVSHNSGSIIEGKTNLIPGKFAFMSTI
ncbi:hypothetical protein DFA_12215 [Cavenderia fasciculata]|uniref:Uncharacterized protein n=1 Tax=Cavenderia fasciculata TaxID=261658 RepID=F4QCL5_CACFS|nr:uncharacterized protein DFA_12215 [Cavenderia fasciculata]EGG14443.1 hypothetical protein DFA_12215 [Cavenderia fasciculata]|eukprot:XP_004353852.1 hypothetical protein DFA_12215 [Cavenderia fasciculata]